MKIPGFIVWLVLAAGIVLSAACGTGPSTNTATGSNSPNAASDHSGHDMSNMGNHNMAVSSAPDAASQPFDLQFIDTMTHHHDGALAMAAMVIPRTQRPELKAFAEKIVSDQKKEMETMRGWRDQWYGGKPTALNLELPGMKMSEMEESHRAEMEKMPAGELDLEFLEMMTQHHEGAVLMAKEALKRAERPEIRKLAEGVIKEQEAEIRQMRQ